MRFLVISELHRRELHIVCQSPALTVSFNLGSESRLVSNHPISMPGLPTPVDTGPADRPTAKPHALTFHLCRLGPGWPIIYSLSPSVGALNNFSAADTGLTSMKKTAVNSIRTSARVPTLSPRLLDPANGATPELRSHVPKPMLEPSNIAARVIEEAAPRSESTDWDSNDEEFVGSSPGAGSDSDANEGGERGSLNAEVRT